MKTRLLVAGSLLLALTLLSCHRESRPNVLLLTLDTTRADRLGCYGYDEPTSPTIDQLAAEGYLFETAVTTNPVTLPAHTSILTGTYPLAHGVRNNGYYHVRDEVTTLAEVLNGEGYRTAAVVGAFVLDSQFNLDQGFDLYDDEIERDWSRDEIERRRSNSFGFAERKANLITYSALGWLEDVGDDPFFLWLHYFDPHEPRNSPEPHHSRFASPYDSEIAYTDEQIGKLFDVLRKRDLWEDTLIVLVADHGEGLLDHSETTHSLRVFDTTMQVPLIFRIPGRSGGHRISDLASVVDIFPTLLDLLGIESPVAVQGRSLVPLFDGEGEDPERKIYFESLVGRLDYGWGELRGLRSRQEKLIHGPNPRYYRVDTDPGEVYNRAAQEPEAVQRLTKDLARKMSQWSKSYTGSAVIAPEADTLGKLAALGYVGGAAGNASLAITDVLEQGHDRQDPHEQGHLFDLFSVATEYLRTGDMQLAIRELQGLVDTNPEFEKALTTLGTIYATKNDPQRASEYYRRALEVSPDKLSNRIALGGSLLQVGELQEAGEHLRMALDAGPDSPQVLFMMAVWHLENQDLDQTRVFLERTLVANPNHKRARNLLDKLQAHADS